jgi:hypothetical protein
MIKKFDYEVGERVDVPFAVPKLGNPPVSCFPRPGQTDAIVYAGAVVRERMRKGNQNFYKIELTNPPEELRGIKVGEIKEIPEILLEKRQSTLPP